MTFIDETILRQSRTRTTISNVGVASPGLVAAMPLDLTCREKVFWNVDRFGYLFLLNKSECR